MFRIFTISILIFASCQSNKSGKLQTENQEIMQQDSIWKSKLTPIQYNVTREKGTEYAFTGEYYNHFEKGIYKCICCGAELFKSDTKFESSCGWPSFFDTNFEKNIKQKADFSHGMSRTEVMCKNCDAHLGHVFNDGPPPTGLRYCINSASLKFESEK